MLYPLLGKIWKRLPRRARIFVSRSFQTKFTVSAGGIITDDQGRVLLLDHVLRPMSGWGVPGGFLDAGEQPEAAFRREVREETGLDLADVSIYRAQTTRRHIEFIFLARAIGTARVLSPEITALGWFAPDGLPAEMALDQQFMIRKALKIDD